MAAWAVQVISLPKYIDYTKLTYIDIDIDIGADHFF